MGSESWGCSTGGRPKEWSWALQGISCRKMPAHRPRRASPKLWKLLVVLMAPHVLHEWLYTFKNTFMIFIPFWLSKQLWVVGKAVVFLLQRGGYLGSEEFSQTTFCANKLCPTELFDCIKWTQKVPSLRISPQPPQKKNNFKPKHCEQ